MGRFTYENQGAVTFLVYFPEEDEKVDSLAAGMAANNRMTGVLVPGFTQQNMERQLKYNISSKITLEQYFSGNVKKRQLTGVLKSLTSALIQAEGFLLDESSFLLDWRYIYVDVGSAQGYLLCFPLEGAVDQELSFYEFVRRVIYGIKFEETENCAYIAVLMNYINRKESFSYEGFLRVLEGMTQSGQPPVGMSSGAESAEADGSGGRIFHRSGGVAADGIQVRSKDVVPGQMPARSQDGGLPEYASGQPQNGASAKISPGQPQSGIQGTMAGQIVLPGSGSPADGAEKQPGAEKSDRKKGFLFSFGKKEEKPEKPKGADKKREKKEKKEKEKQEKQEKKKKGRESGILRFQIPGKSGKPSVFPASAEIPRDSGSPGDVQTGQEAVPPVRDNDLPVQQPAASGGLFRAQAPALSGIQTAEQPSASGVPGGVEQRPVFAPGFSAGGPGDFGNTVLMGEHDDGVTVLCGSGMDDRQERCIVLTRLKNGQRMAIEKECFRIGKASSFVDFYVGDNRTISRSHADILVQAGNVFIQDNNSMNHTYVNEKMVMAGERIPLRDGDRIRLSDEEFSISIQGR